MGKRKTSGNGWSFISDEDFNDQEEAETLDPSDQMLKVLIDRKARKGKEVTIVANFVGTTDDLNTLGKSLKSHCASGGSVKDGEILIQGNHRDKIMAWLDKAGYRYKRVGG